MKKNTSSWVEISTFGKARPLTLEQVLQLRDGLNIVRGDIPGQPVQIILPNFNRKKGTIVCMN
jgi:hypothetical protein